MAAGGARPGAGRPKGSAQKITTKAREEAMKAGMLPHEWLLKVARGEPIPHKYYRTTVDRRGKETKELVEDEVYADFATRVDAAKAVAPYFAPKLSAQTVSIPEPIQLEHSNKSLSKDELLAELKKRGLPTTLLKD